MGLVVIFLKKRMVDNKLCLQIVSWFVHMFVLCKIKYRVLSCCSENGFPQSPQKEEKQKDLKNMLHYPLLQDWRLINNSTICAVHRPQCPKPLRLLQGIT